jgi:putative ABC transport system permease protein
MCRKPNIMTLLKSYFKISWRNIVRNKGYSAINIIGLAIGIATCLLSYSYIRFELSYDDLHPDVDRLYRVNQTMIWRPEGGKFDSTGPALAQALNEEYPEIEEVLRINTPGASIVRHIAHDGTVNAINEENILAADSNFFRFLNFPLKEGNPETALTGVNKVVISEAAAKKFFGEKSALGKTLLVGEERTAVEITGVTETQPDNIHFHFDYLLSLYTIPNIKQFEWSWIWTQVVTYAKLRENADEDVLEAKLATLGEKRVKPSSERYGIDYDQIIAGKGGWNFYLQPVRDIRLHSVNIGNRLGPLGDITYVWVFGIIGLFVLILAAINYINLSTARAATRAREIGVKKTLGAYRNSLVWQFQVESILVAAAATFLAVFLAQTISPMLVRFTNIDIPVELITSPESIPFLFLIPVVTGMLAGLYPAFYLTRFKPVQVLKGKISSGSGDKKLRNTLVTIQFIISIIMIAGTLIIYRQIDYLLTKDLGFDKENIMVVNQAEKLGDHLETFRDEVKKIPGVVDAAIAMDVPGGGYYEDIWLMEGSEAKLPITELKTDPYFFDFMEFSLVSGRKFNPDNPADKIAAIPNESAVRLFGYEPEEALGKKIIYPGDEQTKFEIIGVVEDFHYHSLRQPVSPMVMIPTGANVWGDMRVLVVKFREQDIAGVRELRERIGDRWEELLYATPFQVSFLDQQLEDQYESEKQAGSLLAMLSGLSIIVAVIGLTGLVSYTVEFRKKEIGIRKIFGASISQIILMLNIQYFRLILIALVIATPVTWWLVGQWLNSFAYKTTIHWAVFVLSGLGILVIAFLCVGYLSLRAARLNPAEELREE